MEYDINLIRKYSNPWPKTNPRLFFINFWEKEFRSEISDYYNRNNNGYKDGIKIYFDQSGSLHIRNCFDIDLHDRLERRVRSWYSWICKNEFEKILGYYSVGTLIIPYVTDIRNGFKQVRYRGLVSNLSQEQYNHIVALHATHRGDGTVMVDSGIPSFDRIIEKMIRNQDIFPKVVVQ